MPSTQIQEEETKPSAWTNANAMKPQRRALARTRSRYQGHVGCAFDMVF